MNTNRDFLVIVDCKNGTVVEKRPIRFFNTDRNVSNLFIKLVIPIYVENDVVEYAELENASDYEVTLNVITPSNELKTINSTILSEGLIFTIDFPISFTDAVGVYLCEFIISTMVNGIEEILTTEPFNYNVQGSISSNLGDKIEIEENLVQQLLEQIARLEEKVVTDDRDLTKFAKLTDLQTKVDREIGKSLISDTEIERLAQVDNYDDSVLRALINTKANLSDVPTKVSQLENDSNYATKSEIPTRVGQLENDKNYTTQSYVINKINEAKLEGSEGIDLSIYVTLDDLLDRDYVSNSELNTKGYITETEVSSVYAKKTELHSHSNKAILDSITQEKINSWESKTSFSGNYNDLTNKPTIPTNVSQLINDSGYLTQHQDLSEYAKITDLNGYATEVFVNEAIANAKFDSSNIDLSKYAPIRSPKFTGSISLGRRSETTIGDNSVALGANVTASGYYSFAEGVNTTVINYYSHIEGKSSHSIMDKITDFKDVDYYNLKYAWDRDKFSLAKGIACHVEGKDNMGLGDYSHAEGDSTITLGIASHAEGNGTIASGNGSHAEGGSTEASGVSSHAEGHNTKAIGEYSHAEGFGTNANGNSSHAEGFGAYANGKYSHAEGFGAYANGDYSHAEGLGTTANEEGQHVQGTYNIEDTENRYAHITGNGIKVNETIFWSNAHTLDWQGNGWFQGEVYVGGTSQDDGKKLLSTADIYFDTDGNLCVTIGEVTKKFAPM